MTEDFTCDEPFGPPPVRHIANILAFSGVLKGFAIDTAVHKLEHILLKGHACSLPLRSAKVNVWISPFTLLEFQDQMGFHRDQTHLEVECMVSVMKNVIFIG